MQAATLAHAATKSGDLVSAESHYRQAQDILDATPAFSDDDPFKAVNLHHLANVLTEEKKYAEAEQLFLRASKILEADYEYGKLSKLYGDYAALLRKTARNHEADEIQAKAK